MEHCQSFVYINRFERWQLWDNFPQIFLSQHSFYFCVQ